jgi:hypothetical protein
MNEGIPRVLLALTVIVAVGTISLAIKDHFQEKKEQSPTSGTPIAIKSDATTARKKISVKTKARTAPSPQDAEDDVAKPIFVNAAKGESAAQAAQLGEAMDQNNPEAKEKEQDRKIGKPPASAAQCMPLPNGTNPADVDARYYKNWATEYSCLIH